MQRASRLTASFCALFLLATGSQSLSAAVIPLPSTGTDSSGNLLPGGSQDPHYEVSGPAVPGGAPAVVYSQGSLFGGWVPDDPHSGWIGFQDSFSSSPHGDYTYELTVDLTGYDPSTASISGDWAADQFGSIKLNGNSTGVSVPDGNWNAATNPNLTHFTIGSGFQSGINKLDFVVNEPDDGDGLRIRNLSLTATPVPEPSTISLLAGAVAILGTALVRRAKSCP